MQKKVIAVIFGGMSTEHEVSMMSAKTVISGLSPEKYFVFPIYITKEGKWLLYEGVVNGLTSAQFESFGTSVVLSPDRAHHGLLRMVGDKVKPIWIDVVFPVLHGKFGEDGTIQGLCALAGIPCVGSGVLSSAACMDKAVTKLIVSELKIKQAEHIVVYRSELENIDETAKKVRYKIKYPCFVKPANAGSSVGVSEVKNKAELTAALSLAAEVDYKILVEKAITGRELECAVLGNENPQAAGVGEILPANDFYDYEAKYSEIGSKTVISPELPEGAKEKIRQASLSIYKAMECRGLARVDFFLEENGDVVFNEINTLPGFTSISMYPMLWKEEGKSLSRLCDELVELAVSEDEKAEEEKTVCEEPEESKTEAKTETPEPEIPEKEVSADE